MARREPRPPIQAADRIGGGRRMTEKIEIEGPRRAWAYQIETRARLVEAELCAGQRTQSSGIADCDRQLGRARSGHRRLDDGYADAE